MNIDELLASYDPIDMEYTESFNEADKKSNPRFSFIPTKEECEDILLAPLRAMVEVTEE